MRQISIIALTARMYYTMLHNRRSVGTKGRKEELGTRAQYNVPLQ